MTLAETIQAEFLTDHARSMKLLAAIPEDQFGWKPHEKSMSLGQLACHLAESPAWACGMVEGDMDMAESGDSWKPFEADTHAALMAKAEECQGQVAAALEGRDDDFMNSTWTMRAGDQILIQEPMHQAMRNIMLLHQAHHRGQVTVYLRMLGIPVPATFGPSADDQSFA